MKTKKIIKATGLLFICTICFSLTSFAQEVKDNDGQVYKTAGYGKQVWLAGNLNVSHFRNGDAIPQAITAEEWADAAINGKPAWCFYENDTASGRKYSKLYNWYAINDPRGLVPEGWHVAANNDWRILVKNLLGIDVVGNKLKSRSGWKSPVGTDNIGFCALPGGYRDEEGKFRDEGKACRFWSNSVPVDVKPSELIYTFVISDNTSQVKYLQSKKGAGYSVRCTKD